MKSVPGAFPNAAFSKWDVSACGEFMGHFKVGKTFLLKRQNSLSRLD